MLEHAQVCLECGRRPDSDSPVCPCGHHFSTVPVELVITLQALDLMQERRKQHAEYRRQRSVSSVGHRSSAPVAELRPRP